MDGPWHVLHYIGHGDFDPLMDEGVLALEREDDGRADLVSATRMVESSARPTRCPRLVVLNSCSGATTGTTHLFSGTAAALVHGGISAVVAMEYAISMPPRLPSPAASTPPSPAGEESTKPSLPDVSPSSAPARTPWNGLPPCCT